MGQARRWKTRQTRQRAGSINNTSNDRNSCSYSYSYSENDDDDDDDDARNQPKQHDATNRPTVQSNLLFAGMKEKTRRTQTTRCCIAFVVDLFLRKQETNLEHTHTQAHQQNTTTTTKHNKVVRPLTVEHAKTRVTNDIRTKNRCINTKNQNGGLEKTNQAAPQSSTAPHHTTPENQTKLHRSKQLVSPCCTVCREGGGLGPWSVSAGW